MKNILLVKCYQYEGPGTVCTYPLGLMYIASYLRNKNQTYNIKIYDMRVEGISLKKLLSTIEALKPFIVGLSAISVERDCLYDAIKAIKSYDQKILIVAGGPHPSNFPQACFKNSPVDIVAIGEGELTFYDIVTSYEKRKPFSFIHGIAYRNNEEILFSPQRSFIEDLDSLPFPSWDLIKTENYWKKHNMSALVKNNRYMNIFTSRACPYSCIYCHSIFGKKFRPRKPENILLECKTLMKKYKITDFEIIDDIFNWDLERAKEILTLLLKENPKIRIFFPNGLRSDKLDREFLEILAKFKFSFIAIPVESASQRIQVLCKKKLNLAKVKDVIALCAKLKIYTRGYFMLGFPNESRKEICSTINFAARSKLHSAFFFTLIPFEGTELYKLCKTSLEKKLFSPGDFNYFHSSINLSALPDKSFFRLQKWASLRFYLNPFRIFRILRDSPSFKGILDGIRPHFDFFLNAGTGNK